MDSFLYTVDNTEASNSVVLDSCYLNVFYSRRTVTARKPNNTKQKLSGYIHHFIENSIEKRFGRLYVVCYQLF